MSRLPEELGSLETSITILSVDLGTLSLKYVAAEMQNGVAEDFQGCTVQAIHIVMQVVNQCWYSSVLLQVLKSDKF